MMDKEKTRKPADVESEAGEPRRGRRARHQGRNRDQRHRRQPRKDSAKVGIFGPREGRGFDRSLQIALGSQAAAENGEIVVGPARIVTPVNPSELKF